MALPWALRGLRDGVVTSRWPSRDDEYFDTFAAAVDVDRSSGTAAARRALADQPTLDQLCPTGALSAANGDIVLDRGRCVLCARCIEAVPSVFSWDTGSGVARISRRHLVLAPSNEGEDEDEVARLRSELAHRVRRLRRSVHIRHVDAGSDGSDEWEVQALLNPVYDIHRLGIFFTASPRHADILLVTGIGAAGMTAPLQRTREAMPDPVIVIATGAEAVSGGLFAEGYSSGAGVAELLDVDVWVPGSPASPFSLMHAILLALDRVPSRGWPRSAPTDESASRRAKDGSN